MPNEKQLDLGMDWNKLSRQLLRTFALALFPSHQIYDLFKDLQRSRGVLELKVKRAASALDDASKLVTELEGELTTKIGKVEQLKYEYERYQQLAAVEEGKARALIEHLQLTLDAGRSRERWIALAINLVAGIIVFFLGVLLSPWIKACLGIGG